MSSSCCPSSFTFGDPSSALHVAISHGHPISSIRSLLLSSLLDDGSNNSAKWTSVHLCVVARADPEVLRMVLAEGGDPDAVDAYGETPLTRSVLTMTGLTAELLRAGANAGRRNADGYSPLDLARRMEKLEMVNLLMKCSVMTVLCAKSSRLNVWSVCLVRELADMIFRFDADAGGDDVKDDDESCANHGEADCCAHARITAHDSDDEEEYVARLRQEDERQYEDDQFFINDMAAVMAKAARR